MKTETITQEYLKSILDYNPDTGMFVWRENRGSNKVKGTQAGHHHGTGYRRITLDRKLHMEHRLAFLYMTGEFPKDQVDHINGVKDDNRWENLRDVNQSTNMKNAKIPSNNSSGIVGVDFNKAHQKWQVRIYTGADRKSLGYFQDFFEACSARKSAEVKHGYHVNHGRTL